MRLILASGSPRRAEILTLAAIPFTVVETNVNEIQLPGEAAAAYVQRLAYEKAQAASRQFPAWHADAELAFFLGADTCVAVDERIFGKPVSAGDAQEMLRQLAGRVHQVFTGVALLRLPDRAERVFIESTDVTFAAISDAEISSYVASGEPFGKAGGYAIQGTGGKFAERIEGNYFNVVGLPLPAVVRALRELGYFGEGFTTGG
jgi:septum formation protein